jgi:hypothetical protein
MEATLPAGQKTAASGKAVPEEEEGTELRPEKEPVPDKDAPMVLQICVPVRPCPAGESISDWTRFVEGIRISCAEYPLITTYAYAVVKKDSQEDEA